MRPGFLITLEGVEGSGKSTQAQRLKDTFESRGAQVFLTFEPGGTETGKALRSLLLQGRPVAPVTELMLFMADRHQHWREAIRPALQEGMMVIVDRFSDSTVAYQGYGRGLPIEEIHHLNRLVLDGDGPDFTALIDVPLREGMRRIRGEKDKIESEDEAFHSRIREGYLAEARRNAERIVVYDGRLPAEELARRIFADAWSRFEARPVKTS
ncbi:MAG: dTMP kinase [bacterium]